MPSLTRSLLASFVMVASVIGNPAPAATCTGTISSLNDVAAAVKCTNVVINSFTVPAGQMFNLNLASGTTVTMSEWAFRERSF